MAGSAHTEIEKTTLFEELCDINTLFGYVGLGLFLLNLYTCLFQPFLTGQHIAAPWRAVLLVSTVAGLVVSSFAIFAIKQLTNGFHENFRKRKTAFLFLVFELAYPAAYLVSMVTGSFVPPVFAVLAFVFGIGAAGIMLSWEIISWKLQIWSFSRFLCVTLFVAAFLVIVLELAVAEQFRLITGCFAVFASILLFHTIGEGKRSEFVVEREDSVAHLFIFDKRVDIAYFCIQAVCGSAIALLLMRFHAYFLITPVVALVLLTVFIVLFGSKRSFSGQFLQREIRSYASLSLLLLIMLMVPNEMVNIAALCCLGAAWFTQWVFQGIFLERILGYGPISVYFVAISNTVNNLGFLIGIVFAAVLNALVADQHTIYLIMLIVGAAALLIALFFLPVEAATTLRHPEELQTDDSASDTASVDSLNVFLMQRAAELADTYLLSPREAEVLRYLARGSSAKYIGSQLGISDHTVRVHVCHIYEKMGVHSKQSLMALFDEGCPE